MLKIDVNENITYVEMEGTLRDILTDLIGATNKVYRSIYEKSPDAATVFKCMIQLVVAENTSPIWQTDDVPAKLAKIGVIDFEGCTTAAQRKKLIEEGFRNIGISEPVIQNIIEMVVLE